MSYGDETYDDADDDADDEPIPRKQNSRSSGWTCLVMVLAGGGLSVLLLCCGGGGGLIWFGLNVVTTEIEDQLRDNETLKEHVGVVESFALDFTRTTAKNDPKAMVFQVKGSEGEGSITVVADTDHEGRQVIRSAILRLPDGKEIPLVP